MLSCVRFYLENYILVNSNNTIKENKVSEYSKISTIEECTKEFRTIEAEGLKTLRILQ